MSARKYNKYVLVLARLSDIKVITVMMRVLRIIYLLKVILHVFMYFTHATTQSQMTVSAYFTGKQILPYGFAEQ